VGYGKEMKESLVPILFGGKIEVEKNKMSQIEESRKDEQEEEKKDSATGTANAEKEFKFDQGFNYIDVVCGSSQTLAIID
jgi:hypothetical protein